jgi:lipid-A-disaccharide synthase-like uncharacterized protein
LAPLSPLAFGSLRGNSVLVESPVRVRRGGVSTGNFAIMDWHDRSLWLVIGFAGNAVFFLRFVIQWLASERAGRSYVPVAFWWLSIAGSLVLLAYAIHRRDPVFTLAFLPNCVVYVRNLMLIRKERLRHAGRAPERRDADPIWAAAPGEPNGAPRPIER